MNHPTPPRLKSNTRTTHQSSAAEQPVAPVAVGAQRVVAEGVPSGSDPHPTTGRRIVGMLHITLPDRGTVPAATSRCECGRDLFATGHHQVLALVADHTAHRALCPLLTERKEAA